MVTANLARCLASVHDKEVGVLDIDLCGPSQPTSKACDEGVNIFSDEANSN